VPPVLKSPKLPIELVPESCWFSNVRTLISLSRWQTLQNFYFAKTARRCAICAGRGPVWPVELHEVWSYAEDPTPVQRLVRFEPLCPACHQVKHIGLAFINQQGPEAVKHLGFVNRWDEERCFAYIKSSFAEWERRSKLKWTHDLAVLYKHVPRSEVRANTPQMSAQDMLEAHATFSTAPRAAKPLFRAATMTTAR
jgi:hypothetical protein